MQIVKPSNEREGVLSLVTAWWRNWADRRSAVHELDCCGEGEAARIARDVGVSPSELRTLAGRWPNSADLLSQRIAAVRLDAEIIGAAQPQVMRDLQRVCTQCEARSRCEHDLEQGQRSGHWREYCPNVRTLDALRTEDRDRRWMRRRKWRPAEPALPPCC